MAEDVSIDILEQIKKEFKRLYDKDPVIQTLLGRKSVPSERNANEYAKAVGNICSRAMEKFIISSNLPDGTLYFNIAEKVIGEVLGQAYSMVADYTASVQSAFTKRLNLNIKAQVPSNNVERINNLVSKIASNNEEYDDLKEAKWLLDKDVTENIMKSAVNDTVKENADFLGDAGLTCYVIRRASASDCLWCQGVTSNFTPDYPYKKGTEPSDFWRFHKDCNCYIDYDVKKNARDRVRFERNSFKKVTDRLN